MRNGWIKIPKSFFFDWFIRCDTLCPYSAWIYLCTIADDKGRVYTSKRRLQSEFGWGRNGLNNFLKALEEKNLITIIKDGMNTLITIRDYEQYKIN